jgi:O-antigen ligase
LVVVAIAAIGAAYCLYGLIAARLGQLPWLDIRTINNQVTATFVDRDSFATYDGICLVAGAGLLFTYFRRELDDAGGSLRHQAATLIEACGREGALLLGVGFVLLAGLLLTGSRGGTIAMGGGLIALGLLTRPERDHRSLAIAGLGFAALIATTLAFGGLVGKSVEESGLWDPNRMAVYALTLRSIIDAPLSGFGYGTFAEVFRMYRDHSLSVDGVWGQAHDTYLEVLQGLGLLFGLLLIGSVVRLVFRCIHGARHRRENAVVPQVAVAAACVVGLHALVDFSLQIQAVALTFMALLGAGVAQSESSRVSLED